MMTRFIRIASAIFAIMGVLLPWSNESVLFWMNVALVFSVSPAFVVVGCWLLYCVLNTIAVFRENYTTGIWLRLVLLAGSSFFFLFLPFPLILEPGNIGYICTIIAYILGIISHIWALFSLVWGAVSHLTSQREILRVIYHSLFNRKVAVFLSLCLMLGGCVWYSFIRESFEQKCGYLLNYSRPSRITPVPQTSVTSLFTLQLLGEKPLTGIRNPTCAFLELAETDTVQSTARLQLHVITVENETQAVINWGIPYGAEPLNPSTDLKGMIDNGIGRQITYQQRVPIEQSVPQTYFLDVRIPKGTTLRFYGGVLSDGDDIIVQANSMRVIQPTPWSKSVYIEHKDSIELQHSEGGVNTLQTLELTIQATNALTGTLSWNLPESLQLVSGLPTQSITIPQGETQHFRIVVRPLKAIQYELSCSLRDPSGRDIAPNYTQMVMYVTETKVTATR